MMKVIVSACLGELRFLRAFFLVTSINSSCRLSAARSEASQSEAAAKSLMAEQIRIIAISISIAPPIARGLPLGKPERVWKLFYLLIYILYSV